MELLSKEVASIEKQVSDWIEHPEYELEATFGIGGRVDATTFMNVAKRLRAKGYTSLPQIDRMTIMTSDNLRFTLFPFGIIQQYCIDDTIAGKNFEVMIKDRSTSTSTNDISEYNFRIKTRREIEMAKDDAEVKRNLEKWKTIPKAFRILRRWSFLSTGIRIDMSIVNSTSKLKNGSYKWHTMFRDQAIMKTAPVYEIEVELLRLEGDTKEVAVKRLIKGIGEVLRGIQKNSLLIRNSVKNDIIKEYTTLINSKQFRGPNMRTLQKRNFSKERVNGEANIRDGYNVTDKADGLRCLGYCNGNGELFLIDMSLNVYRTGLKNIQCRKSLVDGEWVTLTKDKEPIQQFLLFDIFYMTDENDVSSKPFKSNTDKPLDGRYENLKKWITTWNSNINQSVTANSVKAIKSSLEVSIKDFKFGNKDDNSIFEAARKVLHSTQSRVYYTDGLIFTPNSLPLPGPGETFYEQFKWKPPADNTVDFLVRFEKEEGTNQDKTTVSIDETNQDIMYKTLRLFVGSSVENARDIILNNLELPRKNRIIRGSDGIKGEYRPKLFSPREIPDTFANICNLKIEKDPDTSELFVQTEDGEPIQDNTIVEMSYNPKAMPGWRWIPERIRTDKTERLQSGILARTLNSEKVAEDVWNSIYDPITNNMIITGNEQPSNEEEEELQRGESLLGKKYYNRISISKHDLMITSSMRAFHNSYIKDKILYRVGIGGVGKTLIDTACGVGADLRTWAKYKVSFVLGIDYSDDNINGVKDSIYRRYLEAMVTAGGRDSYPKMAFVNGNSTKNYLSGDAGTTDEEKNILRSVLAGVKPVATLPPYVQSDIAARLKQGADCMSCMFAIHYFFENESTLNGYLRNISENLKVGGYFIGCCFDGDKVFELLRNTKFGSNKMGLKDQSIIWTITKQYDAEEMSSNDSSLGLAIDVNFTTIGTTQREYLVSFKYLTERMKSIGCELLSDDDLKSVGLKNSSAMFETSWEMSKNTAGEKYNIVDSAVREFSFLNRWFIFKRTKHVGAKEESKSGLNSLKASANELVRPEKTEIENEEEAIEEAVEARNDKTELTAENKTYTTGELFQFYNDASERDILGIKDPKAAQWISPGALFPIEDSDTKIVYPTLEHYMAAMRYKYASNKPELAGSVFGKDGTIHQEYLRKRQTESEAGTNPLSPERERELNKLEMNAVRDAYRLSGFKRYRATFDDAKWASKKDVVLREGLKQRWETDARFRKIVEAARDMGKTLLYYTPGSNLTNLGGIRKNSGVIDGDNKMGKIIMELAGYQ